MQPKARVFSIVSLAGLAMIAESAAADVFYPIEFYGTVTTPSCTVRLVELTHKHIYSLQVRDCSLLIGDSILSELFVSYGPKSNHLKTRYLYTKTVPIEAPFNSDFGFDVLYGNGYDRQVFHQSYGIETQQNFNFSLANRQAPFDAFNIELKYK